MVFPKETFLLELKSRKWRERRAFFKRAAAIGLPVVLATVRAQTAWAATNDTRLMCVHPGHLRLRDAQPLADNLRRWTRTDDRSSRNYRLAPLRRLR